MDKNKQHQPTEQEIWALTDKNPRGEEPSWPERIITWNPREFYLHTIAASYQSRSGFEWLFHFLQDKAFSKHKKERVLRILFRNGGRQVRLIGNQPLTFMVVSQPEHQKRNGQWDAAHAYTVTQTKDGSLMCPCQWEEATANAETCTHSICVRCYYHFLEIGRIKQTSKLQGEIKVCAH